MSGRAGPALDLAEQPFGLAEEPSGRAECLLGLAGLQGWAGSVGCVSGSWDSASLSWAQNGNLCGTAGETIVHLDGKCQTLKSDLEQPDKENVLRMNRAAVLL